MQLRTIFSSELLERYKSGIREFSGINLQYADISGCVLKDIVIKDSKFFIFAFYNCDLTNAKFINCEMVYGSFYGGRLENAVFDKCSMDLMLFENTIFKRTKILRSTIIWSGIFGTALGELDLASSTLIKVLTDPSQITQQYVDEAVSKIGPVINSLDISIRAKIKEEMQRDATKYNVEIKTVSGGKPAYEPRSGTYSKGEEPAYGASMHAMIQNIINAYSAAHPYQTKKERKNDPYMRG